MGNLQAQNIDTQSDVFFSALPEDIMILLADIISLQDFVHLTSTCKYYYYHLLGANNILWARMCHSLGGPNKVLKDLQFYNRWKVANGQGELDLTKELDLTDKQLLRSIDFKKEIFNYYLLIINNRSLRHRLSQFSIADGNAVQPTIKVLPFSFWTNLSQYWTRADLKSNNFVKDYFYEVDLFYDPISVESHSAYSENLPSMQNGRLIVYKKSKLKAPRREPFARTMWPREDQLELQLEELAEVAQTFREAK